MNKKILMLLTMLLLVTGCGKEVKEETKKENKKENTKIEEKVDIIDLESNSRPYAVVVNNYTSAVKVQSGLNEAYIIYEIPIEGGLSRSLALFKDKENTKIGTVRSARQNYLDYVMEHDAIFVHFGWNHRAEKEVQQFGINNIDGNYMDPKPFWRENPEGLATEHTVYTSLDKIVSYAENTKKYKTTTDKESLLNYSTGDVDLSSNENVKIANTVVVPYSDYYNVKFVYNQENKVYDRYVNGNLHKDYFTKEIYSTKNIIITLLNTGVLSGGGDAAGNSYLNLYNIGEGNGYYITNGYAIPITWKKTDRGTQTKYLYKDKEIDVSDGNTYIMIQDSNYKTTIE